MPSHSLGLCKMQVPYSDRSVHPSVSVCVHASVRLIRKKWWSPFYSIKVRYIQQPYTNSSCWHDLLMPHGGLFSWPTFHAWVTIVRKKWWSLYYSTYWCYIHQTCTNCSSWHDWLIPVRVHDLHFRLDWPLSRRNGYLYITVPMGATFTKLTPTVHLDIIYLVVCVLDLHSHFSDQDTKWQ